MAVRAATTTSTSSISSDEMTVRMWVIVKVGHAPPDLIARTGDFEHWFARGLGVSLDRCRVVDPRRGDPLPDARECSAVVITGSASMVTDRADWSVRTTAWLPSLVAADVPTLGVCYGHQLLAEALGGEVARNPRGRQMGTMRVDVRGDDPIVGRSALEVQTTHEESVVRLPSGAELLATTERDPHHAFRVGRAWGVQFHPEMDAEIIRYYVNRRRAALVAEGFDPEALIREARDTPDGTDLLRRFAAT